MRTDTTLTMPFGKYKDLVLSALSAEYLLGLLKTARARQKSKPLYRYIAANKDVLMRELEVRNDSV